MTTPEDDEPSDLAEPRQRQAAGAGAPAHKISHWIASDSPQANGEAAAVTAVGVRVDDGAELAATGAAAFVPDAEGAGPAFAALLPPAPPSV